MSDKRKKQAVQFLVVLMALAGLAFAYESVTHSAFYGELERLNMDNHKH